MPLKLLSVSSSATTLPDRYPVSISCDCCHQLDPDHPHKALPDLTVSKNELVLKLRDQGWSIVDKQVFEVQSTYPLIVVMHSQLAICSNCTTIVYDAVNH